MRILFLMGTETNFNPGKISSIETLVMKNGSLSKGKSIIFQVDNIIEYFEKKYKLTSQESDKFSAGKIFKDYYSDIVKEIQLADLIITFDYFDYYDIFYAKEFFLSSPLEKAEVLRILEDKLLDLSIFKEENQDIFDLFNSYDKNLTSEIERIKQKLFLFPKDRDFKSDPNKLRVTLLVMIFCILVNHGELTLNDKMEKDVTKFIEDFFGGMIF